LKTILIIAIQTIERLEYMHDIGYLHRDLKPENIMIGQGKKAGIVHLIDFGLAKRYIDPNSGLHIA
jgi:serine/threonine protein kinase